ncbi:hypothetical protein KIN20_011571 [Parelaphostrongylus tenuis]|uniref:Kinetochore protein Nuf2 N-terminal domain-containing protein n=1 Tax=Parelaphostrongylus tenuis TaxID=148309 RepID=A0AAD5M9L6_PARTN|nr:hypothetical protein KIN20_011571 [Parelaphostrongylus tenuis]
MISSVYSKISRDNKSFLEVDVGITPQGPYGAFGIVPHDVKFQLASMMAALRLVEKQSFRNVFDSSRPRSIVDALTCLNVDINVEDVVHPKADRIQLIYNAFCTQILGVPERSLSELPFDCNCNSETAELHQRSIPLTLLFTTMRCFTTDFGDESCDFTIRRFTHTSSRAITAPLMSPLCYQSFFDIYRIFDMSCCRSVISCCEHIFKELSDRDETKRLRSTSLPELTGTEGQQVMQEHRERSCSPTKSLEDLRGRRRQFEAPKVIEDRASEISIEAPIHCH